MKEQMIKWCTQQELKELNKSGYFAVQVADYKRNRVGLHLYEERFEEKYLCLLERDSDITDLPNEKSNKFSKSSYSNYRNKEWENRYAAFSKITNEIEHDNISKTYDLKDNENINLNDIHMEKK